MKSIFLCCVVLVISLSSEARRDIYVKEVADPKEALALDILKLAINKSGNAHNYNFVGKEITVTEARLKSMVQDGELSVMWAGFQERYETEMLPIRIPVLKGLLGHRIFMIRQGDQAKFDHVRSLVDLQVIPLGQGRFWGDTAILKHNNMLVVDPVKYQSLVYMLEGGRFDYFPRAVHEPWSEVENFADLNLTVEEKILLIYPFAMYFYVGIGQDALAKDIDNGFRAAIDDGSYNQLFFNHPMVKSALAKANLKERVAIPLTNPNLPKNVPLENRKFWLDISKL